MGGAADFPSLSREALWDRLEAGGVGLTVNRRLARFLKGEYDRRQRARGLALWPTPQILPLSAWLERTYDEASLDAALLPLSPLQEQALWERVIGESEAASPLLEVASTASLAREAWQLAHAYRLWESLQRQPLNEDGRVFLGWASRYRELTEALTALDAARLLDMLAAWIREGRATVPRQAVLCGFEEVTPQERELFAALAAAGCTLATLSSPARAARAVRVAFPGTGEEIEAAARWARARLSANPHARIGVVVPDLARQRRRLERVFVQVMRPASGLPGIPTGALPFNVSLGEPLSAYPLVDTALAVLELLEGEADLERLGSLLRSPFIAGAEDEQGPRAALDAALRSRGELRVDLRRLRRLTGGTDSRGGPAPHAPVLAQGIEALRVLAGENAGATRTPSRWAEVFFAALAALGFPGSRPLTSEEYQTHAKWRELLAALAALDEVTPHLSLAAALARVKRMAADTLFQPESPEAPVQILGVLEAAPLAFDHLWVTGLTDESWPPSPRPNPFLPFSLQARMGLPHGCAEREFAFARGLTEGWFRGAKELVLSHPQREGDRDLAPSPLIADVPAADPDGLGLARIPPYAEVIHASGRLERFEDLTGPLHPPELPVRGGTRVFRDQASCPFRAFAVHRLGSRALDAPQAGLSPAERGRLLHGVLAQVWRALGSRRGLEATSPEALSDLLRAAADRAVEAAARERPQTLRGRYAALEKERLARLAGQWLEVERGRGDFEVEAVEASQELAVGGLSLRVTLDRVDRLPDGRRVILDYKTGETRPGQWEGERPEEPQLPLYALGMKEPVAAVAFARVRPGDMGFRGVAAGEVGIPGVVAHPDWEALLDGWRRTLEALAQAFAAGFARVDPKRYPATCRHCDQGPLCRIHERVGLGPTEPEEGDD
ncbi:MAG: PD-(D/E)XK nuclease family protein [Pseudomonadota bacterium]